VVVLGVRFKAKSLLLKSHRWAEYGLIAG